MINIISYGLYIATIENKTHSEYILCILFDSPQRHVQYFPVLQSKLIIYNKTKKTSKQHVIAKWVFFAKQKAIFHVF